MARRRGFPAVASGLAASTAGEEPRQDPAKTDPTPEKELPGTALVMGFGNHYNEKDTDLDLD